MESVSKDIMELTAVTTKEDVQDANALSNGGIKDEQNESLLQKPTHVKSYKSQLQYSVDEDPGWCLTILLGFQHYLTMFGGSIVLPFVLASVMCFDKKNLVIAEVMNTLFFVYGISTLLQSTIGVRLPIIQGGSFAFVGPATAILNLPMYRCSVPSSPVNESRMGNWGNLSMLNQSFGPNATEPPVEGIQEVDWTIRMNVMCGAIMVASVVQVIVGFSGIIGVLLRFIGPMTTGPVICLVGLHLYPVAVKNAGTNWIISGITVVLVLLFSLYLTDVGIPIPWYTRKNGLRISWFKIFKLFPLILAVLVSWAICGIMTVAGAITDDVFDPGYMARTDARIGVIREAKWFKIPYPGQWGTPVVTVAGVVGTLAGVITSIVESIGDYYACARLAGAKPPPTHAINRGIGIEGIGCILAGALGAGNGVTSFSENIAAIGITRVGSRCVVQCAAVIMVICGILGKLSALFTTIPTPVIGGVFLVLFGLIAAVGVANLQFADLNSARNLTIFGFSILSGMGVPYWIKSKNNLIDTGSVELDQIITVLLTTEIAVGGFLAFVLDNTAPGTRKERGIIDWESAQEEDIEGDEDQVSTYDLPGPLQRLINGAGFVRYLPFLPYHRQKCPVDPEC